MNLITLIPSGEIKTQRLECVNRLRFLTPYLQGEKTAIGWQGILRTEQGYCMVGKPGVIDLQPGFLHLCFEFRAAYKTCASQLLILADGDTLIYDQGRFEIPLEPYQRLKIWWKLNNLPTKK